MTGWKMPSGRPSPWTFSHLLSFWRRESVHSGRTRTANDDDPTAEVHSPLQEAPSKETEAKKPYRKPYSLSTLAFISSKTRLFKDVMEGEDAIPDVTVEDGAKTDRKIDLSGTFGEVCHITENPFRVIKIAEQGNLTEFQKMVTKEPWKLTLQDNRGRQPLHFAAMKNQLPIIEYILQKGADLNCQDDAGNTPMHLAVENEAVEAIELLLLRGANSSIQNKKYQAPIHYAVVHNRVKSLRVLMKYRDKVNVLQGDARHGRTALHLAAIYDHAECAEVILADMKKCCSVACNNGYYPIHEAAKCASASTLEVILKWGESLGCTRSSMMKLYDAEGNDPLHSAVNGGDIKAVQLCLERGARISSQQHDLSTPVHLACSQGALSIIQLMFNTQPEEKALCLSIGDAQRMTPLHCAAMFDHKDIVEYLVLEGANINAVDMQHRSPLLLAASRGGWKSVEVLMRLDADITLKDACDRNVLHFIVMNGGRLEHFARDLSKSLDSLNVLLDHKDTNGCTPMHYASRNGHCKSIENLIRLGARINLKNNENQSPLHFAARFGRYNTCLKLLESEKGPFIINETDGEGSTPLHIASINGHTSVVQLLLARGALLHRDHNGRTPLHLASMNGYTQTMELLLAFHAHLLDQVDKDGNTALHLAVCQNKSNAVTLLLSSNCAFLKNNVNATPLDIAIQLKNSEAALAMVGHEERGHELLHIPTVIHRCIIEALIIHLPDVYMGVLDKSITQSSHKKDSKDFYFRYNFIPMQQLKPQRMLCTNKNKRGRLPPLPAMNTMVNHGRVELLTHPVCQKYMEMKWHAYGMHFHMANLFVYIIFLILLTTFVATRVQLLRQPLQNMTIADENQPLRNIESTTFCYAIAVVVLIFITLNVIKELFQLYQQRMRYLFDLINFFEWVLYITSIITIWPIFTGEVEHYQIPCSAVAVFLAWFNFLISLQRFDLVGIYVVMFLEILNTLLKVLLLFSILIFAFGFAFHILMIGGNQLAFTTAPISLVRVFSMMLGDLDFMGTYVSAFYQSNVVHSYNAGKIRIGKEDERQQTLPFPYFTFTMLIVFMVLMPILLMNLLIGLAVGDIEAVRRNAQLKRIAKQVELHTELERKLPRFLLQRGYQEEYLEYPNRPICSHSIFWVLLQKIFGTLSHFRANVNQQRTHDDDYLYEELAKQKRRFKEISISLQRQHQLLRLIVQKMEIRSEADDFDEATTHINKPQFPNDDSKWKSPTLRKTIRSAHILRRLQNDG